MRERAVGVLDTFSLAGRTAVVTGASRGIGRALAIALAEAGSDLALLVRDPAAAEPVLAEVRAKGVRAEAFAADVVDRSAVERAAAEVVAAYGRVDILVNNAGACVHRPALEVPDDEWRQVIDVNVTGVWHGCQAFGRHMTAQGRGSIVNIGSISAQIVNRPQ